MAFTIVATPILGTYRGHHADRTIESFPSVDRLFNALLSAAGFGPRAIERDGELGPCDADEAALLWLESHPPESIRIPPLHVTTPTAIAYRYDGALDEKMDVRKPAKSDSAVAVAGSFAWTWQMDVSDEIVDALRTLCDDVPVLGTSESPMILRIVDDCSDGTHVLDRDGDVFASTPGLNVEVPQIGRRAELGSQFRSDRNASRRDGLAKKNERSASFVPTRRSTHAVRYESAISTYPDVPWPNVLLVPLDKVANSSDRVAWSTAAHKAMIQILGASSPPCLTGVVTPGAPRRSNNVALQLVDGSMPVALPPDCASALAVMIPRNVPAEDVAAIRQAVDSLDRLYPARRSFRQDIRPGVVRRVGAVVPRSGSAFWDSPPDGSTRLWKTVPAAVPDTRGYQAWTFQHAALLSMGFVWRGVDGFPPPRGRGRERDTRIVADASAFGVAVLRAAPLRVSNVDRYVHRVNPDAVVRPYRATLHLGDQVPATALMAIGQSRHFGGGLLVPSDRPTDQNFQVDT